MATQPYRCVERYESPRPSTRRWGELRGAVNKRPLVGSSYASQMRTLLDGTVDATTNWPSVDPLSIPAGPTGLNQSGVEATSWNTETGRVYRLEQSADLCEWHDTGLYAVGDSQSEGHECPVRRTRPTTAFASGRKTFFLICRRSLYRASRAVWVRCE